MLIMLAPGCSVVVPCDFVQTVPILIRTQKKDHCVTIYTNHDIDYIISYDHHFNYSDGSHNDI